MNWDVSVETYMRMLQTQSINRQADIDTSA